MWYVYAGLVAGGLVLGAVLMAWLAADNRRRLQTRLAEVLDECDTAFERMRTAMKEAQRWRDRALLCEEKGPTCGEVDEVYRENVRLKAKVEVLEQQLKERGS